MMTALQNVLNGIGVERTLILYVFIGGTASFIDVSVFVLLYEVLGVSALLSHSISIPLSALFSFSMNARYNFKKTDRIFYRALSFSIVVTLGYLLGAAVITAVQWWLPEGGTIGKVISLPLVFIFQYILNAKISFRD